jgi:hypothetical protein
MRESECVCVNKCGTLSKTKRNEMKRNETKIMLDLT